MSDSADSLWISKGELQRLIDLLWDRGYSVIGPQVQSSAIVYDQLRDVSQLPQGWTEVTSAGSYRLVRRSDDAWFGFNVGPHAWKRFLFPSQLTVATARQAERLREPAEGSEEDSATVWLFETPPPPQTSYAFLGVRACDLAAIAIQDRVFMEQAYVDPAYAALRTRALVIAVNCTQAISTCFCTSMKTGPKCEQGFDLALTELPTGFTIESGSARGAAILEQLETYPASHSQQQEAAARRRQAVADIGKHLETTGLRETLLENLDHPHWADVAQRCISCTNCTMVCPTCFCSSVDEVSDLEGVRVDRERRWDSCFNLEFSAMNGGRVRDDIRSRYRQWLTHKLATWIDQFGTSGCVGCGRCITWCPVGIDLTEEVAKLRTGER